MSSKHTASSGGKRGLAWARFLIWTALVIGLLLLTLIIIAVLFEEKIAGLVIDKLRESLKTELKVEKAELSLIRNFPSATVRLRNVELGGSVGSEPLAKIEQIGLRCGIFGLLTGDYDFKTISISNGEINLLKDKKGNPNYDVWKSDAPSDQPSESSPLKLSIRRMELQEIRLRYNDQKLRQDMDVTVRNAYFSGDFNNDLFNMDSYAELESHHLTMGKDTYLENKRIAYEATFEIDNQKGIYRLPDIKLTFESNKFIVSGDIENGESGLKFNGITVKSERTSLNSVLKMMPKRYLELVEGFDSYADLYFTATVNGPFTDKVSPIIDVKFGLKEGRVMHTKMDAPLKGVSFDIHFTNGDGKNPETAIFELNNFKGFLGTNAIDLRLVSKGMDNPTIDFSFNGKLNLASVYGWFGENASGGSGSVDVRNLVLRGRYNDMLSPAGVARSEVGGSISFDNALITANNIPVGIETGNVTIDKNLVTISNFMLKCADSDLVITDGTCANLVPFLFADSLNTHQAFLGFFVSVKSKKFDIDKLLDAFRSKERTELLKDTTTAVRDSLKEVNIMQRARIAELLKGALVADIKELRYGKFLLQDFNGLLEFDRRSLMIKGLKLNTMEGEAGLDARVVFAERPVLEAYVDLKNINIETFFSQMDNFGQETLKDRHIRGVLTSLIKINAYWDERGNLLDDKLFVLADVLLRDGELIAFTPLEKFSAFIKIQDLRHIKFAEVRNQFRIENRAFYMPAMFLRSNALNLIVSGYHSFDQDIDYKIKINVDQVIAQKFKKYNPELTPLKAKRNGLFNIHGRITGNINRDDIRFIKGKKGVKEALDADLAREMPILSNALRAEFARSGVIDVSKIVEMREPDDWSDLPGDEVLD